MLPWQSPSSQLTRQLLVSLIGLSYSHSPSSSHLSNRVAMNVIDLLVKSSHQYLSCVWLGHPLPRGLPTMHHYHSCCFAYFDTALLQTGDSRTYADWPGGRFHIEADAACPQATHHHCNHDHTIPSTDLRAGWEAQPHSIGWDCWLSFLFFTPLRDPQVSTGFSSFNLLYGRDMLVHWTYFRRAGKLPQHPQTEEWWIQCGILARVAIFERVHTEHYDSDNDKACENRNMPEVSSQITTLGFNRGSVVISGSRGTQMLTC